MHQHSTPSRLYCLTPRGLGSRYVESLTCYTVRLAKAHCLRTLSLMKKEIGAVTGKLWLTKEGRHEDRKYLNGMGTTASDWVIALETLTGCQHLKQLSFLSYKHVIDGKGLMYPHRRWCPRCYEEWLNSGEDVYDPIAWYFNGIQACLLHQVLLAVHCPHCSRTQPFVPMYPELSICAHCQKSLAGNYTKERVAGKYDSENTVAEFLILASRLKELDRSDFVGRIKQLVSTAADGNCSVLARLVGISRACIENWCRGVMIPKLQSFCQLCRGLETGPLEFFSKRFPPESFCAEVRSRIAKNSLRKNSPLDHKCNWNHVEKTLIRIVNAKQRPETVSKIEKQLQLPQGKLYERFPTLCRKITQRHYSEAKGRIRPRCVAPEIIKEFNRSMKEEPPIPVNEFARRIKYNKDYLYGAYPFISHKIRSRFREYQKQLQREHETQLLRQALAAHPPVNIAEFTKQTGLQKFYLRRHHGDLCRKLSQRYIQFRSNQTVVKIRETLKRNLEINPPPSTKSVIAEICQSLGWKGCHATKIYRCAGNLVRAITDRRNKYEEKLMAEKRKHYQREVKRVVSSLQSKGEYPSFQKIARLVRPKASYTTPWFHKIADEVRSEFGLTARRRTDGT
ncbi:TniQ family protein [bacterium]|nr:TniQ family protein [bacterium]